MEVLQHKPNTNNMKQFFLKIYYFFANFRKRLVFSKFEKKLQEAVVDKRVDQANLMLTIKKEIDKLWPKGRSKYIPLSLPQRLEIKARIEDQFGEQMKSLHIKVNSKLEFV
jgi:hypothetical protein